MNSFYLEESTGEFRKGRGVDFPHGSPLREAWTFLKSGFGVGLMQFALYIIAVIGLLILFIMVLQRKQLKKANRCTPSAQYGWNPNVYRARY